MYTVYKHMDGVCVERYVTLFTINLPILFLLLLKCAHFYKEFLLYTSVHVVSIANQCFGITFLLSIPACIIHYYLLCDRVLVHLQCCRTIFIYSQQKSDISLILSYQLMCYKIRPMIMLLSTIIKCINEKDIFCLVFFPFFAVKCAEIHFIINLF